MKKKWILILLVPLVVINGIRLVKSRKKAMQDAPLPIPVSYTVRTVVPQTRTVSQTAAFLARLEPVNQAMIASKLSGQIVEMPVSENQAVEKGDLLVQLDDQELRANLAVAKQQSRYNQDVHQRNQVLFDAGGLPQEKLDASAVAVASAKAVVQGLESQLEYTRITAPFDGTVGTLFQRMGDLAAPGKPILSLNSKPQKLTFSFAPESGGIQPGMAVRWQGQAVGTVAKIYPDARGGLAVAEVIPLHEIDQPSGSYLTLEVATRTQTGCAVPLQALLRRHGQTRVMVQQDKNSFQPLDISVLAQDAEFAVVEPALSQPVAVASEAKLALLPAAQGIRVISGDSHE